MYAFSNEEILRLLSTARAARERDFVMILVAYLHGLRVSEVLEITPDHLIDGHLAIQRLKGSKFTTQPLISHDNPLLDERSALAAYSKGKVGNQRLFNIGRQHFWRLVQKHGRTAGLPTHKCHPHTMKHTHGTEMTDAFGVAYTQQRLGHKSAASSLIYSQKSPQQANEAFDTLLKKRV